MISFDAGDLRQLSTEDLDAIINAARAAKRERRPFQKARLPKLLNNLERSVAAILRAVHPLGTMDGVPESAWSAVHKTLAPLQREHLEHEARDYKAPAKGTRSRKQEAENG